MLYGKSATTLGQDTKRSDIGKARAAIGAAYKAGNTAEQKAQQKLFEQLLAEDKTDYAQGIIDKMFAEFPRGHAWMLKMQKLATERQYVFSPIGRIRHLYGTMTGDRRIISKQVRRGMNAPIQGFASEISVKAARLTMLDYYKVQKDLSLESKPLKFSRTVHDASYYAVPHEMVIPFLHLLQYNATYGISQLYEKQFGLKFMVEPEIELEFAVRDDLSLKWNWELPELKRILETVVAQGVELDLYSESKEVILEKIYAPWKNKEHRKYLNDNYPLLGVDLYKELGIF